MALAHKKLLVEDSVENMFRHVKYENDDAVDDNTIRMFCEHSASNFEWLELEGVRFVNKDWATRY